MLMKCSQKLIIGASTAGRQHACKKKRGKVEVGSLENQPKPRTGKDGLWDHARLGLVDGFQREHENNPSRLPVTGRISQLSLLETDTMMCRSISGL
jgi:hypothetical protein